jgi:hypothetical protein
MALSIDLRRSSNNQGRPNGPTVPADLENFAKTGNNYQAYYRITQDKSFVYSAS